MGGDGIHATKHRLNATRPYKNQGDAGYATTISVTRLSAQETAPPGSAKETNHLTRQVRKKMIVAQTLHLTQKEGLFVDHDTDCVLLGPTLQPGVRQQ